MLEVLYITRRYRGEKQFFGDSKVTNLASFQFVSLEHFEEMSSTSKIVKILYYLINSVWIYFAGQDNEFVHLFEQICQFFFGFGILHLIDIDIKRPGRSYREYES